MVYDCFCFFNELDLLEIRLNTLDEVVDRFVLVEAAYTHTGTCKPLYFADNSTRFAKFRDKIIHIVVNELPPSRDGETVRERAWSLENFQRNAISKGLTAARPDDIIIVSDIDEIPNPAVLKKAMHLKGITRLGLRLYYFYFNYRNLSVGGYWQGPQLARYADFTNPFKNTAKANEFLPEHVNCGATASSFRMARSDRMIINAGWHFSYLGNISSIREKLAAIAHTEFNTESITDPKHLEHCIANGINIFGTGDRYYIDRIDHSFPPYIREHKLQFKRFIFDIALADKINRKTSRVAVALKLKLQSFILDHFSPSAVTKIVTIKKKLFPGRFV